MEYFAPTTSILHCKCWYVNVGLKLKTEMHLKLISTEARSFQPQSLYERRSVGMN